MVNAVERYYVCNLNLMSINVTFTQTPKSCGRFVFPRKLYCRALVHCFITIVFKKISSVDRCEFLCASTRWRCGSWAYRRCLKPNMRLLDPRLCPDYEQFKRPSLSSIKIGNIVDCLLELSSRTNTILKTQIKLRQKKLCCSFCL